MSFRADSGGGTVAASAVVTASTFSGTSATRTTDLTLFAQIGGAGGVHTVTHWELTATKNGAQLTGKITYDLEQRVPNPPTSNPQESLKCAFVFGGTLKWEFPVHGGAGAVTVSRPSWSREV